MERYIVPVAQTRSKPPRVWLLFLQAIYRRAVLGTTICKTVREILVRPTEMTGSVKWTTLKGGLKSNVPVGPNRNGPFNLISKRAKRKRPTC